jgi:hypothetical protein
MFVVTGFLLLIMLCSFRCRLPKSWQSQAPTYSNDRLCAPVTVCEPAGIEEKAPTANSDRLCRPVYRTQVVFFEDFDTFFAEYLAMNDSSSTTPSPTTTTATVTGNGTTMMPSTTEPMMTPDHFWALFKEAVAGDFDNSTDIADVFVDQASTVSPGSIVVEAAVLTPELRDYITDMAINGTLIVAGLVPFPCPSRDEYVEAILLGGSGNTVRCVQKQRCGRFYYEREPNTAVLDAVCLPITECGIGYEVLQEASYSSDTTCREIPAAQSILKKSEGLNAGVAAVLALLALLIIVAAFGFVAWKRRKYASCQNCC